MANGFPFQTTRRMNHCCAPSKPQIQPEKQPVCKENHNTSYCKTLPRMDSDTLLLLAVLWLLMKENGDKKLLLALAYILM